MASDANGDSSAASSRNKVDAYLADILGGGSGAQGGAVRSERAQRTLVLQMLDGVRGVSIHEQGRMFPSVSASSKASRGGKGSMFAQLSSMPVDGPGQQGQHGDGSGSPDFGGVAELFG